jgi:hypothetical protein
VEVVLRLFPIALAVLVFAVPASAADLPPTLSKLPAGVESRPQVDPSGGRVLQVAIDVPAAPEAAWALMTTGEGWRRMGTKFAHVDFRLGGIAETSYDAAAQVGDPKNIKNQIVAFVPGRMFSIRNIQTPPGFPHAKEFGEVVTTVEVAPAPGGKTRMTITAVGFGTGPAFDELYKHFTDGDAISLAQFAKSFSAAPQAQAAR